MDESQLAKQRLSLWLRGERAFGLDSVTGINVNLKNAPARKPQAVVPQNSFSAPQPVTRAVSVKPAGHVTAALSADPLSQPSALIAGLESAPFTVPILAREEKIAALCAMDRSEVSVCTRCVLCKTRTKTVFGEGDPDASIFFIGEGPGENEDLQGRPFVGRSGDLLNKMIVGMGLKREQVFIGNIVKCRPPGNRVPAPDEVATCTPYLVRQLEIVRPRVIVTLGLPATKYMLSSKLSMGNLRGRWHNWRGIKLMPTFHPSYLLRVYTEENRAAVWSDLKKVMGEVGLPIPKSPRD
jgi:DNA polymerase